MWSAWVVPLVVCTMVVTAGGEDGGVRFVFPRGWSTGDTADGADSGRRMFGGSGADVREFPAVCAVLERHLTPICSGSVIRPHWALTAAHCVTPAATFVRYNARRVAADEGDLAAVHYRYRHPQYRVREVVTARGPDVAELQNDVGLLRTRTAMLLAAGPHLTPLVLDPVWTFGLHHFEELLDKPVDVFGYGRTAGRPVGEELSRVQLVAGRCGRAGWWPVACGARGGGVCAGDSGGPVLLRGMQVGVTSMGPAECAEEGVPNTSVVTVFTLLQHYAPIINSTLHDVERDLRARTSRAHTAHHRHTTTTLLLLALTFTQ